MDRFDRVREQSAAEVNRNLQEEYGVSSDRSHIPGKSNEVPYSVDGGFTEHDLYSPGWLGLKWTDWKSIQSGQDYLDTLPASPGLYRIRHSAYPGLVYIGESGQSIAENVRNLVSGIEGNTVPDCGCRPPSRVLRAICNQSAEPFEISLVKSSILNDSERRRARKAALITWHRQSVDQSPVANFRNNTFDSTDSYPLIEEPYTSDQIKGNSVSQIDQSVASLVWTNRHPLDSDWMGLDWTEFSLLTNMATDVPETNVIYRLAEQDADHQIQYVGTSMQFRSALTEHYQEYKENLRVSYVTCPEHSPDRAREELKFGLIGAHWLATANPPNEQFTDGSAD